jgi:hypothetical protein
VRQGDRETERQRDRETERQRDREAIGASPTNRLDIYSTPDDKEREKKRKRDYISHPHLLPPQNVSAITKTYRLLLT